MTDKQKYAIKFAINTMDKHFGRHYNTVYGNRKTGISVGYGEAITILSDMLSDDDNHTCNCQNNSNPRDNEPCCRCDGRQTNADRIRNMTDEELADILFDSCVGHIGTDRCRSAIRDFTVRDNCKKCVLEWLGTESEVEKDA